MLDIKLHNISFDSNIVDIVNEIIANGDPIFTLAEKESDLSEIEAMATDLRARFSRVVFLGVGGSILAGKTLTSLARKSSTAIEFLDSIDSHSFARLLDSISSTNMKEACFVAISKSGETLETICQTLLIIKKAREYGVKPHFIFITANHDSKIAQIAYEINAKIIEHPPEIGGRFSYLSIVGLLPAAVAGLDISKIRCGARQVINFKESTKINEIVQSSITFSINALKHGLANSVMMPYIDRLKEFSDWWRQLWAESLGKSGCGSTPITSLGTIDQHSQLQLYLDGPRDKCFTLITSNNQSQNLFIDSLGLDSLSFLHKKDLISVVQAEQESTIKLLIDSGATLRHFAIDEMNEETLSFLMMLMIIETLVIAKLYNVNPFGQPAVEIGKSFAIKKLRNK